ncbi:hypothetical protein PIB30_021506 [Stylosanthes scabra]|uniref:Uncharacterized protein n=1 Tax=Stylosanthes scabra TaxID=79078 RepID=A0ABU6Z8K3_9FABA|nr:hypothetical protein [Stylosanthes scabra]
MAVESAVNNSVLKEFVEPAVTRPTARIPVITVVNPCHRALTLTRRGVRIAVTDLTPFLPIRSYRGLAAKKLLMRTHRCPFCQLGVPPKARIHTPNDLLGFVAIISFLSLFATTSAPNFVC